MMLKISINRNVNYPPTEMKKSDLNPIQLMQYRIEFQMKTRTIKLIRYCQGCEQIIELLSLSWMFNSSLSL
jgi:hypothetical protein